MTNAKLETRLEKLASATHGGGVVSPPPRLARSETRAAIFRSGLVRFAGHQGVPCLILDQSQRGARISLSKAEILPEMVCLIVPQNRLRIEAEVRWQRGLQAGLLFNRE